MECKYCKGEMEVIAVNDSPNNGYAYNVFHCFPCMVIMKQDVWKNPGKVWITMRGDIECETKHETR